MDTAAPNAEQILLWNERSGPRWVAMQSRLDAQLEPFGEAALAKLSLRPGMRALDVGCGCGGTTFRLASRVGPSGHVTGVDVSRVMLDRARERGAEDRVDNVTFVEGDAQTHDFGGARFDALFSRFGVMFFADPEAAFRNLRAALAPGAPVAFAAWQPMALNPWMTVPLEAALPLAPSPPPIAPPNAPGPFGFADAARTLGILTRAGFTGASVEPLETELRLAGGGGLEEALEVTMMVGPCGTLLRENPGLFEPAREAVREALRPYLTKEGVAFRSAAWVYTARA